MKILSIVETFLGRGWAFPVGVKDTGGIRTRSGEDDIREAVVIILTTRLGERAMRPELGCTAGDGFYFPATI